MYHLLCFRIFRQPQGHLLLIGVSVAGKTTLSRFVAWMNGLSVYQIKVGLLGGILVPEMGILILHAAVE